jgi:hypothetical protein
MGSHGDKRSFVRRRGFDYHLFGFALLHRAFCTAGKCAGNSSKILLAAPYAIFDHSTKVTGSFSGDMSCHFGNINHCQELYRKL